MLEQEKAGALREGDSTSEVWEITPELAAEWLEKNLLNRKPSPTRIQRYAEAMGRGEWKVTHQGIAFDWNGNLIDGQNRLWAIIRHGEPVKMMVATNVDPTAFDVLDSGKPRNLKDHLDIIGEANTQAMAAVIGWLWKMEHRGGKLKLPTNQAPTGPQGIELFERYGKEAIHQSERMGGRVYYALRGTKSVYGALHYILSSIDYTDAEFFFDKLITGEGIEKGNPIFELRKQLQKNAIEQRRFAPVHIAALIIKGWNHFRNGREITTLVWRKGGANPEMFPTPE